MRIKRRGRDCSKGSAIPVPVTPNRSTHTLDLAGAAFATAQVAAALGSITLATRMFRLSERWQNAFDPATCLLKNGSGYIFYEGTYMTYSFRPVPQMRARIEMCNSTAHFVELMDAFFGYGREPLVQMPIVAFRARICGTGRNEYVM